MISLSYSTFVLLIVILHVIFTTVTTISTTTITIYAFQPNYNNHNHNHNHFYKTTTTTTTSSRGFNSKSLQSCHNIQQHKMVLDNSNDDTTASSTSTTTSTTSSSSSSSSSTTIPTSFPNIPLTWDEMIKQVSSTIRDAANAGYTRQIIRILLPRDKYNTDFGIYYENDIENSNTNTNNDNIILCPTDESWQGGIMQLYRSAAPTAQRIVRSISNPIAGVPLRIIEDRTIDESTVDGIGYIYTTDLSIQCYVQPTQEIVNTLINSAQQSTKEQIIILLNPQWRQVNDALDTISTSSTNPILLNIANFLGGKGNTMKLIQDNNFIPTYTYEGYVCRNNNIRLLQLGYNNTIYYIYIEKMNNNNEPSSSYIPIGTCNERPTYQYVDTLVQQYYEKL